MRTWFPLLALLAAFGLIVEAAPEEDILSPISFYISNKRLEEQLQQRASFNDVQPTPGFGQPKTAEVGTPKMNLVDTVSTLHSLIAGLFRPNEDDDSIEESEDDATESGTVSIKKPAPNKNRDYDSVNLFQIYKPGSLHGTKKRVRVHYHQASKIDNRFKHPHKFRFKFNVTGIPDEEVMQMAELTIARDELLSPQLSNETRYHVLAYDILRPGTKGKAKPILRLVDSQYISLNSSELIQLNIRAAVERWAKTPQKNYGLLVKVLTAEEGVPAGEKHVRLRRDADESQEAWEQIEPKLMVYTDLKPIHALAKRDLRRMPKKHMRICQRRDMFVEFHDIGWDDWIISPQGFDAFKCEGFCPFPLTEHLNATNHAVIQTLTNNIDPSKVPKTCCVPTQLSSLSMFVVNDKNQYEVRIIPDMVVEACGCR